MSHMFGDVFGNKADYVKGMMYASRSQYLVGPDRRGYDYRKKHRIHVRHQPCRPEILQPPDMFLTRAQARKKCIQDADGGNLKRLEFKERRPPKAVQKQENRMMEKKEVKSRKPQVQEEYDYDDDDASESDSIEYEPAVRANQRDAWEQVLEAGVTFWHNVVTGEAQVDSPFEDEEAEAAVPQEEEVLEIISEEEYARQGGLFSFLGTSNWEEKDEL
jgi:hypothetical protein